MAIDPNFRLVRGDVVSVEAVVKYDMLPGDENVFIGLPDYSGTVPIHPKDVTLVRQNLKVGDRVIARGVPRCAGTCTGTVAAVMGDHVWISDGGGAPFTVHRTEVDRFPAEPPREAQEDAA